MSCFVSGCRSHSSRPDIENTHGEHVSFHKFPTEKKRIAEWIHILGQPNADRVTKHSRICSKHFSSDSFSCPQDQKRRRLRIDAVPTLFLKSESNITSSQFIAEEVPMLETFEIKSENNVASTSHRLRIRQDLTEQPRTLSNTKNTRDLTNYIRLLEKQLGKTNRIAHKRLLKISALRQVTRRLRKKTDYLVDKLTELLAKDKIDKNVYILAIE